MAPRPMHEGERRVLTLLFSDLADSAKLAAALDPEDLREVYQQTREIAFVAVERFGGKVKDYIGDGVVAYFGYPAPLERGAQAAVNAGLEMVRELALRRWPLAERAGRPVQMRVGIHTGEVVAGEMGRMGGAHEVDAVVGVVPIVANRIQTAARPNTVVISESTHRLVAGQFEFRELPPVILKGVEEPIALYEVTAPGGVKVQNERIASRRLRPLVGRAVELGRLRAAWQTVCDGAHAGIAIAGEAGIGKSRLMAELKAELSGADAARVWEFQCSSHQANTSWWPVTHALREQLCGFSCEDTAEGQMAKLEVAARRAGLEECEQLWLLCALLELPHPAAELAAALAPEARKRRLMECLAVLFERAAGKGARVFEFNDAHWMDASTAEWLAYLRRRQTPGALVALTMRPGAAAVEPLLAGMDVLHLRGLGDAEVEALAQSVVGGRVLPREVVEHLARNCSGVPLFVEEMVAALLASRAIEARDDHFELRDWTAERRLPFTLRELLQTRLDQLSSGDREVVQVCAAIGGEVTARMVAAVLGEADAERVESVLMRLTETGFFACDFESDTYAIRHALIERAAYESMLKTVRARLHRRIAELLQAGALEGVRAVPELLAEHFTQAGMLESAAPAWLQAAQLALRRSAIAEGVALARRGLQVLAEAGYPAALREVRIALVTTLGTALIASKGFASAEAATSFKEAERLLGDADDPAMRFPALWGLCITHLMQGHLDPALVFATRMLEIGRKAPGGHLLIEALWTRADALFWLGRLDEAEEHLREAVSMYRPEHHANAHVFGQDPGVASRVYLTQLHAFRLEAEKACECSRECLELAHGLRHPHSLAWAMASDAMLKLLLGDVAGALESGPRTIEYCMKQEHPFWLAATKMMTGWALSRSGRAEEGRQMARDGFALYEMLGTNLISGVFCVLLADCCLVAGDAAEATAWTARARDMVERNNERLSLPAVLLMDGQLMEAAGGEEALRAESCYREALECARAQGARLREVQAAALLAQWLLARGRMADAGGTLAPYAALLAAPDLPDSLRPLAAFFAGAGNAAA